MALFKCEKCGIEKKIKKLNLVFEKNKLKIKESKCLCGNYMKNHEKYNHWLTSHKDANDKL